jgi:hypothetical protein
MNRPTRPLSGEFSMLPDVRLQFSNALVTISVYEPKAYVTLVVYVTHAVSTHGLYQVADNVALGAREVNNIYCYSRSATYFSNSF